MTPSWLKNGDATPTPEKALKAPGTLDEGLQNMKEIWGDRLGIAPDPRRADFTLKDISDAVHGPQGTPGIGTRRTGRYPGRVEIPEVNVDAPQRFGEFAPGPYSPKTGNLDSFLADSPLSQNVEDRRPMGYLGDDANNKALTLNTAALQEVNRLLDEWLRELGGVSGGTSSAPYRFTGGGGVAAPGAAGPWAACQRCHPAAQPCQARTVCLGGWARPWAAPGAATAHLVPMRRNYQHRPASGLRIASFRGPRRSGRAKRRTSFGPWAQAAVWSHRPALPNPERQALPPAPSIGLWRLRGRVSIAITR
jgi:hypothetical protein